MSPETPKASAAERVRISCPGCGRNDYVLWPRGSETFHWKCFNCSKQFDLHRKAV
jgi:DNA-directed RNA polymerase subunit RPC12/RpoP